MFEYFWSKEVNFGLEVRREAWEPLLYIMETDVLHVASVFGWHVTKNESFYLKISNPPKN